MFSILILTKNEEINMRDCMESVSWCDDVVVLDSLSDDDTCEIAEDMGARVFERPFDDFGAQRNYALDEIEFRHPWVFHLDADERFNEELRAECERVIEQDAHSAYFVPNKIIFLGKWIKHCTQYPYPQVRLLKIGEVRFMKAGHGQKEDTASVGWGTLIFLMIITIFPRGSGTGLRSMRSMPERGECGNEPGKAPAEGVFFWGWHGAQTCDEIMVCQDALPTVDQVCASLFFEVGIS